MEIKSVESLILGKIAFIGMKVPKFAEKAGFKRATFYNRLKYGNWTLHEIRILDRYLHFTENELLFLIRGQ